MKTALGGVCSAGLVVPQFYSIAFSNADVAEGNGIILRGYKPRRAKKMKELCIALNSLYVPSRGN
jgi:hypothetical protein